MHACSYNARSSVVHMSFSGDFGGREKVAAWLCRAISLEGVSSQLFLIVEERAGKSRNNNLMNALGCFLCMCTVFRTNSRFSLQLVFELDAALRSSNVTIIHCHCYKSLFYALLLKSIRRFSGIVVYTLHGVELSSGFRSSLIRKFHSLALRYSDGIVGCSNEILTRYLPSMWHGKQKAIVNAITLPSCGLQGLATQKRQIRNTVFKRFGCDPSLPLVLNVGRLCHQKNFSLFLRLVHRFANDCHGRRVANFLIVGDGELRAVLELEALHLGVKDHVSFVGFVTDIDNLYVCADLVVQTSTWEGTPMCLLEARSFGLPVVAPLVGGNVDVVRDGIDGGLFGVEDLERLYHLTETYIRDPELRNLHGKLAFEHTGQEFDPSRWAQSHIQFYKEIFSHSRGVVL